MNPNPLNNTNSKKSGNSNPFAKALANNAEMEQNLGKNKTPNMDAGGDFSKALANAGGKLPENFGADQLSDQQQIELKEKQKKERQRRELHKQVSPVEMVDVFSAREKRVKEEIDQVRYELKMLIQEVGGWQNEIDITLMSEVVDPGQDGKYYLSFFQKLRAWIQLLRQRVKSARTWATQMHAKNKKKRRKKTPGLEIGGAKHEKTSTVQDLISNSERNSAYSGG